MASDPQLLSVKEKYLQIVNKLFHLELKKFSKNEYKKVMLDEMINLLPDFHKAQLSKTAHFVSNALNNEVQFLLRRKLRQPATKYSTLLSSTIIED